MNSLQPNEVRKNHPRSSASSADSPRAIEVHIEELVLHGFDPRARWTIGEALENELRRLLMTEGVPASWRESPAKIDVGTVRLTNPGATGREIAGAIHGGNVR